MTLKCMICGYHIPTTLLEHYEEVHPLNYEHYLLEAQKIRQRPNKPLRRKYRESHN